MVKLDNWQTKAEKAAERRLHSKQMKDQKHRTRQNKLLAQQFLSFLQEHSNSILQSSSKDWEIHLWVEYQSGSSPSPEEPKSPRKKGRPRSNSCTAESSPKGRKGRARSNSEASSTWTGQESPRLCAKHFFGSCESALISPSSGRRKSTGSPLSTPGCIHGVHSEETLASVLLGRSKKSKKTSKLAPEIVQAARTALEESLKAATTSEDDDMQSSSIDMLQHFSVSVEKSTALADAITTVLSDQGSNTGSIVYVVFRNMLVFDRHGQGLVLSDQQQELLLCGGYRRRSSSMSSDRHNTNNTATDLAEHLPSQVLEYILRFLPDAAAASLPMVCRAWNKEIGRSSPDLWKYLIDRHQWPLPPVENNENLTPQDNTALHRQAFVSHYLAVRDTKAVVSGIGQFMGDGFSNGTDKDLALFEYKDSIGRPITGPTMLEVWSDTRVLVGNATDCTLHLYDVIDSSGDTGGKRCKQSLRVSVAPFANTRRRHCELKDLKLDNHAIGCLYGIDSSGQGVRREDWLGVLTKDELLCAAKGGSDVSQLEEGVLKTFHLQAKVFEYIKSLEYGGQTEISYWLEMQEHRQGLCPGSVHLSDLIIQIGTEMVACGDGLYLFEAHIALAYEDEDLDDFFEPDYEKPSIAKVFLFSAFTGKISWASRIHCDYQFLTLRQLRPSTTDGAQAVFLSSDRNAVLLEVKGPRDVLCSRIPIPTRICATPRFVAMSSTFLVLADEWISSIEESSNNGNLQFLSLNGGTSHVRSDSLDGTFFGSYSLVGNDDYLLTFAATEKDEVVGRLFHIPCRKVIYESSIGTNFTREYLRRHRPISISCDGGPLAVSVDEVGLFVAGHGVSTIRNETWGRKVKRKKGALKSRPKKDVFARGMRQSMG